LKDERVERDKKYKRIKRPVDERAKGKVKFEVYGEEMIEKVVSLSGNSGRIYLPPDWVGHQVKIVRID
jgi:putative transposon-encoded protein